MRLFILLGPFVVHDDQTDNNMAEKARSICCGSLATNRGSCEVMLKPAAGEAIGFESEVAEDRTERHEEKLRERCIIGEISGLLKWW